MILKKSTFFLLCTFVLIIVSLLTYLNYDRIWSFFTNKEWQIADSIGKIELENYLTTCGTDSSFFVIDNNSVTGYSENMKKNAELSLSSKDVLTHSDGDYCIIGEKAGTSVSLISGNQLVWTNTINNASILSVYVNKNGYSAVIYSQAGYKSLIKVFSNAGKELFTSYLASTYAIDVAISNDNKTFAIAEVDTNGINVSSRIKVTSMEDASESTVKKYDINSNEVVTDIEFTSNNKLVIMTDLKVYVLDNDVIGEILNFEKENIIMASIENRRNIVTVRNEKNGLFNQSVEVCIYDFNVTAEPKKYELNSLPNRFVCTKNVIALDNGLEIIFINDSGNFLKKCEYKGQLKDLKLFNEGNRAVLIFRNVADFIKVGGI